MTGLAIGERLAPCEAVNQFGQPVEMPGSRAWLVFFFPFAFTGICSSELRTLSDLVPRFDALDCRIAAVSCDSMFSQRVFADAEDFRFMLLTDHWPHGALAERFGVFEKDKGCALRASFLVSPGGAVLWQTVQGLGEPRDIMGHLRVSEELLRGNNRMIGTPLL